MYVKIYFKVLMCSARILKITNKPIIVLNV